MTRASRAQTLEIGGLSAPSARVDRPSDAASAEDAVLTRVQTPVRAAFRRLLATCARWITESHARSEDWTRLVDDARTQFDDGSSRRADHVAWCWRCGEHLRVCDAAGARARDGIHARCYGR